MNPTTLLFTAPSTVATASFPPLEPGPGEVLIATEFSCISPGTELRCLAGGQPDSPPWPFVPGYSSVGRITALGAGFHHTHHAHPRLGERVFFRGTGRAPFALQWGGHISHAVVRPGDLIPLPDGADGRSAAFGHLLGIAHHGVMLANPQPGERIVIIGLGSIGQLSARIYQALGHQPLVVDQNVERVRLARYAGLDAMVISAHLAEEVRVRLPAGAEIVVDATGVPGVLAEAVSLLRELPWNDRHHPAARLVVQGSYPADIAVNYQKLFLKEAQVLFPRDCQPHDIRRALALVQGGRLRVTDLADVFPPAAAPAVYARLQTGELMTGVFGW